VKEGAFMELNAIYVDPDDETQIYVGRVALDQGGWLELISTAPDNEGYLTAVIEDINGHEELNIQIAPPAGSPQGSYYTLAYSRSSPDFLEGLIEYAAMHFGLQLVADATLARQQRTLERLTL
jgi:hypothetical protein